MRSMVDLCIAARLPLFSYSSRLLAAVQASWTELKNNPHCRHNRGESRQMHLPSQIRQ